MGELNKTIERLHVQLKESKDDNHRLEQEIRHLANKIIKLQDQNQQVMLASQQMASKTLSAVSPALPKKS